MYWKLTRNVVKRKSLQNSAKFWPNVGVGNVVKPSLQYMTLRLGLNEAEVLDQNRNTKEQMERKIN